MKKTILLAALVSLFTVVYSQEEPDTIAMVGGLDGAWIDQRLSQCLDQNNMTLLEQNQCLYDALEHWEGQLNEVYTLLISQIDEPAKSALKASQTAWINYKNAQFAFISTHYGSMEGAMYKQVAIGERIDVVKKRHSELFNLTQD